MEARHLHLIGAAGKIRTEMHDGREHLVVPVIALMEGVIHAVNAETPEFVSTATLTKAASSWNGRPVVLGHPVREGRQISANDPTVLASYGIGTIFNARLQGKKLLCEAWIDPIKAEKVGTAKFLEQLRDYKIGEVSVGAFVTTDNVPGTHLGKGYKASWIETSGDHLAFLPHGRGACSVEMGCGSHRAASHRVSSEGLEVLGGPGSGNFGHGGRPGELGGSSEGDGDGNDTDPEKTISSILGASRRKMTIGALIKVSPADLSRLHKAYESMAKEKRGTAEGMSASATARAVESELKRRERKLEEMTLTTLMTLEGTSLDERIQAVHTAVQKWAAPAAPYAYAQTVFDDYVIVRKGDELYRIAYTVEKEGEVTFGEAVQVKQTYVAAAGSEDFRSAYGKTISAATMKTLQAAHDASHDMHSHTVALGAECNGMKLLASKDCETCRGTGQVTTDGKQADCTACDGMGVMKTAELKAACRCEEVDVNKAERIAALLKNDRNPIKDLTDKTSDEVLTVLEAQATANAAADVKHKAELKAAQDKQVETDAALRAAQAAQIPAEEQTELRALATEKKAADAKRKTELVAQLKTAQAEYTEAELTGMDNGVLERLARVAHVPTPDYSGRALPRSLDEKPQTYTPPDPYAAGLKALQGTKTVN